MTRHRIGARWPRLAANVPAGNIRLPLQLPPTLASPAKPFTKPVPSVMRKLLIRAELTPSQQAEHFARRKEVWEALQNPDNLSKFDGRGNKGFASDTASKAGVDARTVRRDVHRATAIGPDIKLVAGTSLDKGVEQGCGAGCAGEDAGSGAAVGQRL